MVPTFNALIQPTKLFINNVAQKPNVADTDIYSFCFDLYTVSKIELEKMKETWIREEC